MRPSAIETRRRHRVPGARRCARSSQARSHDPSERERPDARGKRHSRRTCAAGHTGRGRKRTARTSRSDTHEPCKAWSWMPLRCPHPSSSTVSGRISRAFGCGFLAAFLAGFSSINSHATAAASACLSAGVAGLRRRREAQLAMPRSRAPDVEGRRAERRRTSRPGARRHASGGEPSRG